MEVLTSKISAFNQIRDCWELFLAALVEAGNLWMNMWVFL